MGYLQVTLCWHVHIKGIKFFDANMSKFDQSLDVAICYTLYICDVGYTSPNFVINVVILEKSIFKLQNLALFQKYFSPIFYSKWDGNN